MSDFEQALSPAENRQSSSEPAGSGGLTTVARMKAIFAGSAGNLIEWYDFYAYAFTALYFSHHFFPSGDRTAQLLGTSGIFAIGFLARPLGGWFFGWYADNKGRRNAMILSILMMGCGSLMIAALPTFATIGAAAPVLLLVARILQGFSTGGQYGTAATYLSEISFGKHRGFFASFQYVTLIGGQLCALLVILIIQQFVDQEQMGDWGWRVPFLIGALAAFSIMLFRHMIHESATVRDPHPHAGTLRGLLPHWRSFLTVLGITAGGSLVFYVFTTYMQKYLVNTAHMPTETVNWIMTAVLIPFMLMQPLFGALSDRIGRRTNVLLFGVLATLLTFPLLSRLSHVQSSIEAFVLVLAGLAIVSLYTSISGLFKAELFPVHVRAVGVSVAYGIGNAVFGGSAEYVALSFKEAGFESNFYWYVTALGFLSLITAVLMRNTRGKDPLQDAN